MPPMLADAQAHVMGVLDGGEIEVFAPDKGGQGFEKPIARRDIAAAGPRLDIGRPLPSAALRLIIGLGGGHRQADRHDPGIGAQAQIGAKNIAFGGNIGQKRGHLAGDADKCGAGIVPIGTVAVLIKEADQIDIRRIIQLARAHLAHRQHDHPRRRANVIRPRPGQFSAPDLLGHQRFHRQIDGPIRQRRQRAGHLHHPPNPAQIAKRGQQRRAAFGLSQRK